MNATQLYTTLCGNPYPGAEITLSGIGCTLLMRPNNLRLVYDYDGWRVGARLLHHNLRHPGEATPEEVHAEIRRVLETVEQFDHLDSIEITNAQAAALSPLVRDNRRALGLPPQEQASPTQPGPATSTYVALIALDGSGVWAVGEGLADAQMRAADHWRRAVNAPKLSEREWLATLQTVTLGGEMRAVRALVKALDDVDPFVPIELRGGKS
jgi:hypothetical protein